VRTKSSPTASIGIALSVTGYERPHDVLRDADIAMYRAKSRGRGIHEVFDKTMHDRAVKLLKFETELRRSIEREELRVHYQPIVSLSSAKVMGFEALLRWQRGDELVAADEIVPIAEETGLILPIGQWVLREALRQLAEWQERYPDNESLHMHVNLSPKHFLQANLLEHIAVALDESGVDADRLHLEVTESVVIDNPEAAAELLERLRATGVGISLDDFGTGYSSPQLPPPVPLRHAQDRPLVHFDERRPPQRRDRPHHQQPGPHPRHGRDSGRSRKRRPGPAHARPRHRLRARLLLFPAGGCGDGGGVAGVVVTARRQRSVATYYELLRITPAICERRLTFLPPLRHIRPCIDSLSSFSLQ